MIHTSAQHLFKALSANRQADVNKAVEAIRPYAVDAIAVSGVSGQTFGAIVAHALNLPLIVVRKQTDDEHASPYMVESPLTTDKEFRYAIVDDMIATGETVQRIRRALATLGGQAVVIWLYLDGQEASINGYKTQSKEADKRLEEFRSQTNRVDTIYPVDWASYQTESRL